MTKRILPVILTLCFAIVGLTVVAMADAPTSIKAGGKSISSGQYVTCDENDNISDPQTWDSQNAPTSGYAYYLDGTLYLDNFTLSSGCISSSGDLTVSVSGTNNISSVNDQISINSGGKLTIVGSGSAKLNITPPHDLALYGAGITITDCIVHVTSERDCAILNSVYLNGESELVVTAKSVAIDSYVSVTPATGKTLMIQAGSSSGNIAKTVYVCSGESITDYYGYAYLSVTSTTTSHTHSYDANTDPEWSWGTNYSTATAKFYCTTCNYWQTVTATVTPATIDATCVDDSRTDYTATVTFDGTEYTDTETVTNENTATGNHTYSGGICTVCGAEDPNCISIAGTKLSDGDSYSGTTGTATYKDGVLTLNNFTLTVTDDTTAIYSANDLTIEISGANTISSKMLGVSGNVMSIIVDANATLEVSSTASVALLIVEAVIQPASGAILEVQVGNNMTYCSSEMSIEIIETDLTFSIKPHIHDYSPDVTEPTCTKGGYTTYTCPCGDSYVADETSANGHSYTVSWSWDGTSATATVSCFDCGDSYEQKATITTQSNYGQTIYIAIIRVGDVTYSTSKTTGTITIPTTDSTSEVTIEEVETEEPVEGTDTETEADDEPEAKTNPTTGIAMAMMPMAVAAAATVVAKRKL